MAVAHRGAISFGLVHIPVGIYTATQDNDIHFNQLCKEDGSRVRYKKVCSNCGKEVSSGDIVRGFEYEKGKYVTLTDEEFEKAKSEKDRTIHILHFADLKGIRPIYFDKTDHAVPDSGILIETLFFADEIRQAPKEPARPELKEEELSMAKSLISTMVQEFEPEKYHDEYQTRIWEIIRQKIQGEALTARIIYMS